MFDSTKYKKQEYWDERYTSENSFEWLQSYKQLKPFLAPYICKEDRILVLGCGNSPFSRHLYEDGFQNIINVDYSPVCIENMIKTHEDCSKMLWLTMDVSNLTFGESQFDVVIEKATLDAILVEEKNPWHISGKGYNLTEQILVNVSKILKPGGRFLSITWSQPHFRKRLYCRSKYLWSVKTLNLENEVDCIGYFLYIMVKNDLLSESDLLFEQECLSKRTLHGNTNMNSIQYIDEDDDNYLLKISNVFA